MKTITIKNLTIQVDIPKAHGDMVADVCTVIDEINKALQEAGLNCQPQIFTSGIDSGDIEENEPEEVDDIIALEAEYGDIKHRLTQEQKNKAVDLELIHFDGINWLFFESDLDALKEL